ncbi:hypothetical protein [Rhodoglobus sp.]
MVFIPWDADDAEIEALHALQDGVSAQLRAPLWAWMYQLLDRDRGYVSLTLAHEIQSALRKTLGAPATGFMKVDSLLGQLFKADDREILRTTDFLLSRLRAPYEDYSAETLNGILEANSSAMHAALVGGNWRLARRLPAGVIESVQSAIALDVQAGALLTAAWNFAFGVEQQPTQAMDAAVRAVETLAIEKFVPNKSSASLGDAIGTMKAQGTWTHGLRELDGKAPAQETIYDMLQTLWAGQQYRHVHKDAAAPTTLQAQTHVHLAATLVAWLATGAITRGTAAGR